MTTLLYSLASDFSNHTVAASLLRDQLRSVGLSLNSVSINGDVVALVLADTVAKAVVDPVVAGHSGIPYGPTQQLAISQPQQTNDTTVDAVALALNAQPLEPGNYSLTWLCELSTTTQTAGTGARAAIQVNGVDAYENSVGGPQFQTFSGATIATFAAGATPTFQIVFRRLGASSNPAIIRRLRISIAPA